MRTSTSETVGSQREHGVVLSVAYGPGHARARTRPGAGALVVAQDLAGFCFYLLGLGNYEKEKAQERRFCDECVL